MFDSPSSSSGTCLYGVLLVNKSSRNGTFLVTHAQPSCVAATRKTGTEASIDNAPAAPPSPLKARCSPNWIALVTMSASDPSCFGGICMGKEQGREEVEDGRKHTLVVLLYDTSNNPPVRPKQRVR